MWTFNVSKVAKSITSALGAKSEKPGYVKATVVGYAGTMARYIRGGGHGRNLRVIEAMESGVGVKSEGGRGWSKVERDGAFRPKLLDGKRIQADYSPDSMTA